jgi:hypothetical protein
MATVNNQYYVIDDYAFNSGGGGGGSGQPLGPTYIAPSAAAAITVAHLLASILQRPVRLVALGGTPPWTLVQGAAANVALTAVPSGISF